MNQSQPFNEVLRDNNNASITNLIKTNNHLFSTASSKYKATHFVGQRHHLKQTMFVFLIVISTIISLYSMLLFILNLTSKHYTEYGMFISVILLISSIGALIMVFCLKKAYCSISYLVLSNVVSFFFTMVNMMMNNYITSPMERIDEYYIIDFIFTFLDLLIKYVLGLILPSDFKGTIANNTSSFVFIIIVHLSTMKFEYKEKIAVLIIYGVMLIIHCIYTYYYSKNKQMIYYFNVNDDLINSANIGLLSVEFNYLSKSKLMPTKDEQEQRQERESLYSIKYENTFFNNNKKYFTKNSDKIIEDLIEHCVFDIENVIIKDGNAVNNNIMQSNSNLNRSMDNNYDERSSTIMMDISSKQQKINIVDFFGFLVKNKDSFAKFTRIGSASFSSKDDNDNSNNCLCNFRNEPGLIVDIFIRVNESLSLFDILLNDITKKQTSDELNQMNSNIEHYMRDSRIVVPLIDEEITNLTAQIANDASLLKERFNFTVFLNQFAVFLFNQLNTFLKFTNVNYNKSIGPSEEISVSTLLMYISYIVRWSIKERPWVIFDIKKSSNIKSHEIFESNIKKILQIIISLVNYLTISPPKQSSDTISINLKATKEIKDNKAYIKFTLDILYSNLSTSWTFNEKLEQRNPKYYLFLKELTKQKEIQFMQNKRGFAIICENKHCDMIPLSKNNTQSLESLDEDKPKLNNNPQQSPSHQGESLIYIKKKKTLSSPIIQSKEFESLSYNPPNINNKALYRRCITLNQSNKKHQSEYQTLIDNSPNINIKIIETRTIKSNHQIKNCHSDNNLNDNNGDNNFHIQLFKTNPTETKTESEYKMRPTIANESPGISLFPTMITKSKLETSLINSTAMKVLIISQMILPFKKEPELKNVYILHEKNGLNGLKSILETIYDLIIIDDKIEILTLIGLIRIIEFIKLNKLIQGFDDEIMNKLAIYSDDMVKVKNHINNPLINFKKGSLTVEVVKEIITVNHKAIMSPKQ